MNLVIKRIVKSGYFKFFKWGIILFLILKVLVSQLIIDFLIKIFGESGAIIYSLTFFIAAVIFTCLLLVFISWFFKKTELFLEKNTTEYNGSLHSWLGEDAVSESFLKKLFEKDASNEHDDIANLKEIEKILNEKLDGNIVYYKMFRGHLYNKNKKSLFNKINVYLLTLFSSLLTMLFIPKVKEYLISKVGNQDIFNIIEGLSKYEIYSYFLFYISIAFAVYFLTYQLLLNFTERNRRINYLIEILDILIKEKEK